MLGLTIFPARPGNFSCDSKPGATKKEPSYKCCSAACFEIDAQWAAKAKFSRDDIAVYMNFDFLKLLLRSTTMLTTKYKTASPARPESNAARKSILIYYSTRISRDTPDQHQMITQPSHRTAIDQNLALNLTGS